MNIRYLTRCSNVAAHYPPRLYARGRDFVGLTALISIKANGTPRFFSRFCSFRFNLLTLGSIELACRFFTCQAAICHRRVSTRRVLSKSAPVTKRSRWHKDIPTTIKKSLDSAALLPVRASIVKRKTLRLPFSVRYHMA